MKRLEIILAEPWIVKTSSQGKISFHNLGIVMEEIHSSRFNTICNTAFLKIVY